MKKLYLIFPKEALLLLLFLAAGCQSEEELPAPAEDGKKTEITIQEAQEWFEKNVNVSANSKKGDKKPRVGRKLPLWKHADERTHERKKVVSVPLAFDEGKRLKKGSLSKLLVSKDKDGNMRMQVIKAIGNAGYMERVDYRIGEEDFSGIIEIYDWEENFFRRRILHQWRTSGYLSLGRQLRFADCGLGYS